MDTSPESEESAITPPEPPKESTIKILAKDEVLQEFFATNARQSAIANRIADLLISVGIKKEGYKIKPDEFTKLKNRNLTM